MESKSPSAICINENWPALVYGGHDRANDGVLRALDGTWCANVDLPVSFLGSQGLEALDSPTVREEIRLQLDFARPLDESPQGVLSLRLWGQHGYVHPCAQVATVFENELVAESHDGSARLRLSFDALPKTAEVSLTGMGKRFTFLLPDLRRPQRPSN
jgi:hypothetical protein